MTLVNSFVKINGFSGTKQFVPLAEFLEQKMPVLNSLLVKNIDIRRGHLFIFSLENMS